MFRGKFLQTKLERFTGTDSQLDDEGLQILLQSQSLERLSLERSSQVTSRGLDRIRKQDK